MGCTDSKPANNPAANGTPSSKSPTTAPASKLQANPTASKPPATKLAPPPAAKLPPPILGESGELDVSGSNYDKTKGRQRKVVKSTAPANSAGSLADPE